MARKTTKNVIATTTFFPGAALQRSLVREGDVLPSTHSIVKKHPWAFTTPDEWAAKRVRVEQATAAPGEVRNVEIPSGDDSE